MDCNTYNILYKRFLKRGPGQMLDLAGFKARDSFLDLCTGTGRASFEVFKRGASNVVAVDKDGEKLSRRFGEEMFCGMTVRQFFDEHKDMKFDCIFCQQAINYWLKEEGYVKDSIAKLVAKALTSNGKFVFNTFNKEPSEEIIVKEYKLDGLHYAEVSQLVGGIVHHGQFCDGAHPDHQEFAWISSEEFMTILKPYFKTITIHSDGPTDIYVCSNI